MFKHSFFETFSETFMKQSETSAHGKPTVMFHECFKIKTSKYLFLQADNLLQKRMKQRCFTICFIKIGHFD